MALYDNKHWLLSHIRDSFISTDDTGMCEIVMVGEDIPKHLKSNGAKCYPGIDDSDDEDLDAMSESYDIQMDMEFGHRHRSNTAQRLEKMDQERKNCQKTTHIKLDGAPILMSEDDISEIFKRKDIKKNNKYINRQSLLSDQLEKSPPLPRNPFKDYAKFDGHAQYEEPIRKYRIFMCMLKKNERSYPQQIVVISSATVREFIGLICYKYAFENPNNNLKEDITKYGLYITEDDGEVDWDFPCLDPNETISKFEFSSLCLVEMRPSDLARHEPIENKLFNKKIENIIEHDETEEQIFAEDLARMKGHTTAMEAPLYQLYRVYIINKVRTKTEIHLGISGDKIEIDPVLSGKSASRFWHRQRAVSYQMDNIASCDIIETKGNKTIFTLIYTPNSFITDSFIVTSSQTNSLHQSTLFKNHDFEAETKVADDIVNKINNILELRTSNARKEYLAHRERKITRKKSFNLHRLS